MARPITLEDELAGMFDRYRAWAERQPPELTYASFLDEQYPLLVQKYPEAYGLTDEDNPDGPPDQVL